MDVVLHNPVLNIGRIYHLKTEVVILFVPLTTFSAFFSPISGTSIQSCNYEGVYMVSHDNGSWTCAPCSPCPPGAKISQPCRYNSDTVCDVCPDETYVTASTDECRSCTQCQPGYYVDKPCSRVQDRVCKACADGYFSKDINSFTCYKCRQCGRRERVVRSCDKENNAICGGCVESHYREASTWECRPCSECEIEDSIRVHECVKQLGIHSNNVCKEQIGRRKGLTTSVVMTSQKEDEHQALLDMFLVTLCVLVSITVSAMVIACLALPNCLFRTKNSCCAGGNILISAPNRLTENIALKDKDPKPIRIRGCYESNALIVCTHEQFEDTNIGARVKSTKADLSSKAAEGSILLEDYYSDSQRNGLIVGNSIEDCTIREGTIKKHRQKNQSIEELYSRTF